jgi:hypothetical protein
MTTLDTIVTAARTASADRAFTYAGNFGRGEFTFSVRVSSNGNLYAECNAQVSEERALEELLAVVADVRQTVPCKRSKKITRAGFWNMGRFCTSGFAVTISP